MLLTAVGTRLLAGKMCGVFLNQPGIHRPSHHLPYLVAKTFDLGEGGFTRRATLPETSLRQYCHHFVKLLLFGRG
jgi:hypothetical protein